MTITWNETHTVVVKLIPFLMAVTTYFFGFAPYNDRVLLTFARVLPIACLIMFIAIHSMDTRDEYCFSYKLHTKLIILGLTWCGFGDSFLIWSDTFKFGVVSFTIGFAHYMFAFGFQPRAWFLGIGGYVCAILVLFYFGRGITGFNLFITTVYIFVITTLIWRTWARLTVKYHWSWIKFQTAVGVSLFVFSDIIVALVQDKMPSLLKYSDKVIMSLYYMSQLSVALSILDHDFQPTMYDVTKAI